MDWNIDIDTLMCAYYLRDIVFKVDGDKQEIVKEAPSGVFSFIGSLHLVLTNCNMLSIYTVKEQYMSKLLTADNLIEHGVTAQSLSHTLQISYVHAWRIMSNKSPISFIQSEYLKIVLGVHPVYVSRIQ